MLQPELLRIIAEIFAHLRLAQAVFLQRISMRAMFMLAISGEPLAHGGLEGFGEFIPVMRVDVLHGGDWIRHEIGVLDIENLTFRRRGTHPWPFQKWPSSARANERRWRVVHGITGRSAQDLTQTAERGQHGGGITMGLHDARLGEDGE